MVLPYNKKIRGIKVLFVAVASNFFSNCKTAHYLFSIYFSAQYPVPQKGTTKLNDESAPGRSPPSNF